jgi:tetratricopeptide (TPR) repeat protein
MRKTGLTAAVTCVAFAMAVLWPYAVRAQQAPAAAPPPADAPVVDEAMQQAKAHFEAGKNAYNAGDYQGAIREFKAAEALRPSPILAYNIGLANERLGRRRVAMRYYRRYLEQMPGAQNRAEVEGRIATLERDIAAEPPPAPGAPPVAAEQPSDMPPPQPVQAGPGQPPQPTYTGVDPYATSAAPAPAPPIVTVRKKRSLWWVWLIVGIGATALLAFAIWAALYFDNQVVYGERASSQGLTNDRTPPDSRTPSVGFPLFRF